MELQHCSNIKTKKLTRGQSRRLSIATQIVHVPQLLLITEPTAGLSVSDASVIMRGLRTLVNQRCTVIGKCVCVYVCVVVVVVIILIITIIILIITITITPITTTASVHEPLPSEFELFDTLLLLSEGKCYHYYCYYYYILHYSYHHLHYVYHHYHDHTNTESLLHYSYHYLHYVYHHYHDHTYTEYLGRVVYRGRARSALSHFSSFPYKVWWWWWWWCCSTSIN